MTIGFIGLGNMAKAMIAGILGKGIAEVSQIIGSARTQKTRDAVNLSLIHISEPTRPEP